MSLLLVTLYSALGYVLLIPFLGFYGDDFFFGYVAHFFGIEGLIKSLAIDRPFNGYLLVFFYNILGLKDNVFLWHIAIFLIRLLGGFFLFFSLKKIWPNKISTITNITLLFLLYPGLLQQTVPLGFIGWVTNLTLWIISFFFTVIALNNKNKNKYIIFTLISLAAQINSFLQIEFFIGLEAFRFLMITLILKKKLTFQAASKTIIHWIPYLVTLLLFIIWRIFIFKSTRDVTDINWVTEHYYANPLWIVSIPLEILQSLFHTVISGFFIPTIINIIRLPIKYSVIGVILGTIFSLLFYLLTGTVQKKSEYDKKMAKIFFWTGLISAVATLIPIIISGRVVRPFLVYDRYTITSILSVAFVLAGVLSFKFTYKHQRLFMSILLFLSITSHLLNGFYKMDLWNKQKNLWWQLYWRAPSIEKGAMLILNFLPVSDNILFKDIINKVQWYRFYWAEEQIWTAGNLFFNYHSPPSNHFYGDFLQDEGISEKIENGYIEALNNRNIIYTRNFKKSIVITVPSDISCLHILDGDELIKTSLSVNPPKHIFGYEPVHDWCYYFQQASLAKQLKDWNRLSQLKKEVMEKNLKPQDPNEWLPFTQDMR